MKRIIQKWLDQVAYIAPSNIPNDDGKVYLSKFDDSYITRVGMEDEVEFLANRGVTEELTNGVGYSPSENRWYGWSHRAFAWFTIGSEVKKGDVAYTPDTLENAVDNLVGFWHDADFHEETIGEVVNGKIRITSKYKDEASDMASVSHDTDIPSFGRGEWVAETMQDAKQMAIDYNRNIS